MEGNNNNFNKKNPRNNVKKRRRILKIKNKSYLNNSLNLNEDSKEQEKELLEEIFPSIEIGKFKYKS